ncbi:MAG TPA: SpoIIE family protein phosphatase [Pseudonocardiaceae bacterium]|jgi:putative methionine-R-sulfoxide reductase with GAF domain/anti-sigma regulatory factor (Ser/Thr protein kinase)
MTSADQAFHWEGPADPAILGEVRWAISGWGERAGLPADLVAGITSAMYEVLANAAERTHRSDHLGPVAVSINRCADTLTATVSARGQWGSASAGASGGRGPLLTDCTADELTVTHTDGDTTVRMVWSVPPNHPSAAERQTVRTDDAEEHAEERLRGIEAITDPELAKLDIDLMSEEMLARIRELLGVDTATVLQYDSASEHLIAAAAIGIEEEVRQGVRIPFGRGFAGTVAATRKPVVIDHVDTTTVLNPLLWEKGLHSLLGVPMLAGGRLMGVLHVGSRESRLFGDIDVSLLQVAADRLALATQAQVSRAERAAATALQRSLLPGKLPVVPGFDLAARYVPSAELGVGGDWYDVFTLPGDRLGIVIGDVSGHGLASAVVMGRLRSALRAYALDNDSPAVVLDKLDHKANHFEAGAMATVAYGVIDLAENRLRLCLAGHLPPVIAVPGRPTEFVDLAPDPPIGFDLRTRPRRCQTIDLPPGALVCFYTDGLIERRGESIDAGLNALLDIVTVDRADAACAWLMARFVGTRSLADDVAIFVAYRNET